MNYFIAKIRKNDQNNRVIETITARIEEKKEAQKIFNAARQEGKATVMGKYTDGGKDAFVIRLGAIPDGCMVEVHFHYFMMLKAVQQIRARRYGL